ncbi:hypothetical protein LDENG_00265960 [Lucifuga dentata]|nr:hypothetical protein LDENG_00265960 [Lucifuga dentata]
MSTSPGVSEFVSDAFDSTAINQEDLRKEMEQLVLDKKNSPSPDGQPSQSCASFHITQQAGLGGKSVSSINSSLRFGMMWKMAESQNQDIQKKTKKTNM